MWEDYFKLRQQGMDIREIVATLADKYDYDLDEAIKQGKTLNQVAADLIQAQPKSHNVLSAASRGLARGLVIETPSLIGDVLGLFSPEAKEYVQKHIVRPLEKKYEETEPNYAGLAKLIEQAGSVYGSSMSLGLGAGAAGATIARMLKLARPIEKGAKVAEIAVPAIFGGASAEQALEEGAKKGLDSATNTLQALAHFMVEYFGERYAIKAFGYLFGLHSKMPNLPEPIRKILKMPLPKRVKDFLDKSNLTPETMQNRFWKTLKKFGKVALAEGGTESLQDFGHAFISNLAGTQPATLAEQVKAGAQSFLPAALSTLFGLPYTGAYKPSFKGIPYEQLTPEHKERLRQSLIERGFKPESITEKELKKEYLYQRIAETSTNPVVESFKPVPEEQKTPETPTKTPVFKEPSKTIETKRREDIEKANLLKQRGREHAKFLAEEMEKAEAEPVPTNLITQDKKVETKLKEEIKKSSPIPEPEKVATPKEALPVESIPEIKPAPELAKAEQLDLFKIANKEIEREASKISNNAIVKERLGWNKHIIAGEIITEANKIWKDFTERNGSISNSVKNIGNFIDSVIKEYKEKQPKLIGEKEIEKVQTTDRNTYQFRIKTDSLIQQLEEVAPVLTKDLAKKVKVKAEKLLASKVLAPDQKERLREINKNLEGSPLIKTASNNVRNRLTVEQVPTQEQKQTTTLFPLLSQISYEKMPVAPSERAHNEFVASAQNDAELLTLAELNSRYRNKAKQYIDTVRTLAKQKAFSPELNETILRVYPEIKKAKPVEKKEEKFSLEKVREKAQQEIEELSKRVGKVSKAPHTDILNTASRYYRHAKNAYKHSNAPLFELQESRNKNITKTLDNLIEAAEHYNIPYSEKTTLRTLADRVKKATEENFNLIKEDLKNRYPHLTDVINKLEVGKSIKSLERQISKAVTYEEKAEKSRDIIKTHINKMNALIHIALNTKDETTRNALIHAYEQFGSVFTDLPINMASILREGQYGYGDYAKGKWLSVFYSPEKGIAVFQTSEDSHAHIADTTKLSDDVKELLVKFTEEATPELVSQKIDNELGISLTTKEVGKIREELIKAKGKPTVLLKKLGQPDTYLTQFFSPKAREKFEKYIDREAIEKLKKELAEKETQPIEEKTSPQVTEESIKETKPLPEAEPTPEMVSETAPQKPIAETEIPEEQALESKPEVKSETKPLPTTQKSKLKAPSEYFIRIGDELKPITTEVYPFEYQGISLFAHRNFNNPKVWNVTSKETGLSVAERHPTKNEAVEIAKQKIDRVGAEITKKLIEYHSYDIIPFSPKPETKPLPETGISKIKEPTVSAKEVEIKPIPKDIKALAEQAVKIPSYEEYINQIFPEFGREELENLQIRKLNKLAKAIPQENTDLQLEFHQAMTIASLVKRGGFKNMRSFYESVIAERKKRDILASLNLHLATDGHLSFFDRTRTITEHLINRYVNDILGNTVKVEMLDFESFQSRLAEMGVTKDDMKAVALNNHGVDVKDASFNRILKAIGGVTIPIDLKHAIVLINYDVHKSKTEVMKTAFHEIMEVLQATKYLKEKDVKLLKSKFSGTKRAWTEEASDAFADYMLKKLKEEYKLSEVTQPKSAIERIFEKIREFLTKVANYIKGMGFRTEKELFENIRKGEYRYEKQKLVPEAIIEKEINGKPFSQRVHASLVADNLLEADTDPRNLLEKAINKAEAMFIPKYKKITKGEIDRASKWFLPPQHLEHPVVKFIMNALETTRELADELIYTFTKPVLNPLGKIKKDKERYKKLQKAIWDSDAINMKLPPDMLKSHYGFDDELIDVYNKWKEGMDNSLRNLFNQFRDNEIDLISKISEYKDITKNVKNKIRELITGDLKSFSKRMVDNIGLEKYMEAKGKEKKRLEADAISKIIDEEFSELPDGERQTVSKLAVEIYDTADYWDMTFKSYTGGFYAPRIRPAGKYAVNIYQYIKARNKKTGEMEEQWVKVNRYQTDPKISQKLQLKQIISREKRRYGDKAVVVEDTENLGSVFEKADKDSILIVPEKIIKPAPEFFEGLSQRGIMSYLNAMLVKIKEQSNKDTEDIRKIIAMIRDEVLTDIKSRSRAYQRLIRRKGRPRVTDIEEIIRSEEELRVVGGFDTDLYNVYNDYVISSVNTVARMKALSQINEYIEREDIKKALVEDPQLYDWVKTYLDGIMASSNPVMRYTSGIKTLLASWYLGFRLSSAFVQTTQAYTVGAPELAGFENATAEDLRNYKPKKLSLKEMDKIIARHTKSFARITKAYNNIFRSLVTGKGLTEEEKNALEEGHKKGILFSQYVNQLKEQAYSIMPRWMRSYVDVSLWLFQKAEELSREAGFISAYRLAKEKGLSPEEAKEFALKYVRESFFLFTRVNRPLFALKKEIAGVTSPLYILRGYQFNYIGWAVKALRNEHGQKFTEKLIASAMYHIILGGLFAVPIIGELLKLLGKLFGRDIEVDVVHSIKKNVSPAIGRGAELGILAPLLGVDISGSIRLDLLPRDPSVEAVIDSLLGVWRSAGYKTTKAWEAIKREDPLATLEALSPVAFERLIQGAEYLAGKPVRTMRGVKITTPSGAPLELSLKDKALILLGFRPVSLSEQSAIFRATQTIKNYMDKKRQKIYEKIRFADSYENLMDIMSDINGYNEKAVKYGGAIPLITPDSILRVLENAQGEPNLLALLLYEEE